VIRSTGCLRCSGIRIRHHYATSNHHAAASKVLPRRDPRLSNIHHDSNISWRHLRQKALDSFPSDPADKGRQSGPSVAQEPAHQDGTKGQADRRATYPGGRITKRQANGSRNKRFAKGMRERSIYATLSQYFCHLNYGKPFPTLAEAHKTSVSRANQYVKKTTVPRVLDSYLRALRSPASNNNIPVEANEVDELIRVFDIKTLQLLSNKGYSPEDIVAWAWILTAKESIRSVLRLFYWDRQHPSQRRTPLFVVKLLLHRVSLDARAFRILLASLLSQLTQQPLGTIVSATSSDVMKIANTSSIEPQTTLIDAPRANSLIVLLLRRARQLWPAAQFSIAQAYAYYLIHILPQSHKLKADDGQINILRAKYFNSCLSDLSIPSQHNPFISASTQQRAQFELLKAMATHEPVLPVSRRGYQAVVAVQLAHRKTSAEKVFAEQKALSWPPWKEARMGIDSERGNDGMKSRTMQVLSQMKDAGYSHAAWEDVAGILGGWDTDGSPTIQTRSLAMPPNKTLLGRSKKEELKTESSIWAARIRATRTLREAWACFTSYETRYGIPSERIYHAMAKKLIYSQASMKQIETTSTKSKTLPGDGPEVFPEPSSARDVIYVPTEPPSLEELLKQMTMQGVRPGDNFIALLLRTSPNFSTGLKFACAFLGAKQAKALCTLYVGDLDKEALNTLSAMKPRLFDSFIVFLCTHSNLESSRYRVRRADLFPILMRAPQMMPTTSTLFYHEDVFREGNENGHPQTLSHAVKLLKTLNPRRVSAWLPLLQALASLRGPAGERSVKPDVQRFLAWYEVAEAIRWMLELELDPGTDGLMILCQVFSQAVSAGVRDATIVEEGLYLVNRSKRYNSELQLSNADSFEEFVYKGLKLLKSHFDRLVYPMPLISTENQHLAFSLDKQKPVASNLPDMLQVPSPATLHALVRALGTAEDHDGILNLLQWMSHYAPELIERADQRGNGRTMMRRTLTAIRVFLEGSTDDRVSCEPESVSPHFDAYPNQNGEGKDVHPVFSDGRVEEAYNIIEDTEGWGSWPSDDEVREYVSRHAHFD
jgi:hypothetical protein